MKKRIVSLRELIVLVESINSHINYSKKTILDIIKTFNQKNEVKLRVISELIKAENENFSDEWNKTVKKFYLDDCLNKDDENVLLSFGKALGVTDVKGQDGNCRLHKTMLEKQLKDAEDKLREKLRVNTALSFLLAVSVVIIFY